VAPRSIAAAGGDGLVNKFAKTGGARRNSSLCKYNVRYEYWPHGEGGIGSWKRRRLATTLLLAAAAGVNKITVARRRVIALKSLLRAVKLLLLWRNNH
jgi:hypothetical protein